MSVKSGDERLLSGYSGRMFLVITLGAVVIRIGRAVIPPLLPAIIADLSIGSFEAGIALSTLTLCFAVVQYPSGEFSDHTSRTTVLSLSLVLVLAGFVVLLVTRNYPMFLLAVVVIGISNGMYPTTARAYLSDLFVRRRGEALAVHIASIDVGGILGVGLATLVLATTTWQSAFLPIGILLLVPLVLIRSSSDENTELAWVEIPVAETAGRLFEDGRMGRLLVAYSLFLFTIHGIVGFLPTLLQADYSFSPFLANVAFALLFLVGLVFKPLTGLLSDRLPRIVVIVGGFLLTTFGILVLVLSPTVGVAFAGVVLFGIGQKGAGSIIDAYLLDVSTESTKGSDLGAVRTVYMLVGSVGPVYTGYVSEAIDYGAALVGLVVCMTIGTVVLVSVLARNPG